MTEIKTAKQHAEELKAEGMGWKPLSKYPKSAPDVMFWLRDGAADFPIFGRYDWDEGCLWDTNDFGYTGVVVGWTEFTPPKPQQ